MFLNWSHDEQTSLDLVQETFIAAVRHIGSLRDDAKFGSWLFGIAHQKCIQRWRKQNRDEMLRDEIAAVPDEFENSPDDLLIRQEQEAEFMELLNQLPLPQRSVLLLHFVEDFSLEEIAGITGTPHRHGQIPAALRQKIAAQIAGGEQMKTPRDILLKRHQAVEPKLECHPPGSRGSSRRCQSAQTIRPRIDIRGYAGKCHQAFVSGTHLALSSDLGGIGGGVDFDFRSECFSA